MYSIAFIQKAKLLREFNPRDLPNSIRYIFWELGCHMI